MQYSQEHLNTMVYAKFGRQTECIMGNWKIENTWIEALSGLVYVPTQQLSDIRADLRYIVNTALK